MRRSEAVLAVLASANGATLSPAQLQKAAFLLARNIPDVFDAGQAFNFAAYDYGPFDRAVYDEAQMLQLQGLAQINQAPNGRWKVYAASPHGVASGQAVLQRLAPDRRDYIQRVVEWVRQQSFTSLVKSIYTAYPEMRANSIFQD